MAPTQSSVWSPLHRVAFRFSFCYLVLYSLPQAGSASVVDILPWGSERISGWLARPSQPVAVWLGQHLFHIQGEGAQFHPTGSGDTALSYVLVFLFLGLALAATVVWSLLDRKRLQYRTLSAWLRLFVSIVLGMTLLEYGFAKVFPGQFPPLRFTRLNETYGESSPMGLLWTFMSGSRWYTFFGGVGEIVPGVLLFFRRTRTLGALLGGVVLANVFALNLCYDVPVKLYSAHLLLMCLFLAGPDLSALTRLFLLRGQAQLRTDHVPAPERRSLRITGYVALGVVFFCAVYQCVIGTYAPYLQANDPTAPLYGMWTVEHATATRPQTPWKRMLVESRGSLLIQTVDGHSFNITSTVDSAAQTIDINSKQYRNSRLHWTTDPANPRHITLAGPFSGGAIVVDLVRRSPNRYSLLTQGFHWIHEDPPNW
jgi:hypothetical protein